MYYLHGYGWYGYYNDFTNSSVTLGHGKIISKFSDKWEKKMLLYIFRILEFDKHGKSVPLR